MESIEPPALVRLPEEGSKPYLAFVTYATLGAARSLEKVGQTLGKSRVLIERWSRAYHWQARVMAYDTALAAHAMNAYAAQFRIELEAHRKRYKKAGNDLFTVAQGVLATLARSVQGKTIKGEDGKEYVIPTMEMTPNTLAVVARALVIAADLEAHALGLDKLLTLMEDGQALG